MGVYAFSLVASIMFLATCTIILNKLKSHHQKIHIKLTQIDDVRMFEVLAPG